MKKNSSNKKNINNNKIIIEVILIPFCFMYLFFNILNNHSKVSLIIGSIVLIITSLELAIKYLKEVYVYEHKYNPIKVIYGIFNIVLIIVTGLNIIYNVKLISILYLIMSIILLMSLLFLSIKNLIDIKNNKGILYKKAFSSFFYLISFMIILSSLVISF